MARRLACALLALALSGACAEGAGDSGTTITVFAASSLTDAFSEMAREFERDHPQATLRLNFASSSELATQIEQGAEADVFASADTTSVGRVIDAGLVVGQPRAFARNRMTLAIPRANPGGVETLSDLEDPGLVVSLCNEECPAGKYAHEVLRKAEISVSPDSLETEVRGVVTRLQTGEADAGIVYASDVVAAGEDLRAIGIPDRYNVVVPYPIVVLDGAPRQARDFVAMVLSESGRQVLDKQGFLSL